MERGLLHSAMCTIYRLSESISFDSVARNSALFCVFASRSTTLSVASLLPLESSQHADNAPQYKNLLCNFRAEHQFFTAGAAVDNIDSREYPLLSQTAVEVQFHIAGAFEFFINQVVHTAAGINQAGGNYGKAAALLGISGSAEKALGRIKGYRVDTAGQRSAAGRHRQVIGTGQPW